MQRVLREHLETFLARFVDAHGGRTLPLHVERELRAAATCGDLAHGFWRVRCPECALDLVVAFSCKGRGFCPSCCGRRMTEVAAHLVINVLPEPRCASRDGRCRRGLTDSRGARVTPLGS